MKRRVTNTDLAQDVAVLRAQVESNQAALIARFDAGYDLLVEKFATPLSELKTQMHDTQQTVEKHTKQISFWRGAISVIGLAWAAFVAVIASLLRHRT